MKIRITNTNEVVDVDISICNSVSVDSPLLTNRLTILFVLSVSLQTMKRKVLVLYFPLFLLIYRFVQENY